MSGLLRDSKGASGSEYALLLGLIGVIILGLVAGIGVGIGEIFDEVLPGEGEAVTPPPNTPPVIAFDDPLLPSEGLVFYTGSSLHPEFTPVSDDLGDIGFSVTDDATPPGTLLVSASAAPDASWQNNFPAIPALTLSGAGGHRSLAVELAPGDGVSGRLIVTVTAQDEGGLIAARAFPVLVSANDVEFALRLVEERYPNPFSPGPVAGTLVTEPYPNPFSPAAAVAAPSAFETQSPYANWP
jgi:Flp pilus assembly pilin Flp